MACPAVFGQTKVTKKNRRTNDYRPKVQTCFAMDDFYCGKIANTEDKINLNISTDLLQCSVKSKRLHIADDVWLIAENDDLHFISASKFGSRRHHSEKVRLGFCPFPTGGGHHKILPFLCLFSGLQWGSSKQTNRQKSSQSVWSYSSRRPAVYSKIS